MFCPVTLLAAADLQQRGLPRIGAEVLNDLGRLANSQGEAENLWDQIKSKYKARTPALILYEAMAAVLPKDLFQELSRPLFGISDKGPRLSVTDEVANLMESVPPNLLQSISIEVCRLTGRSSPTLLDKKSLIAFLLQETGADAAAYRMLVNPSLEPIKWNFDVFLAHNSVDKQGVKDVGLELKKAGLKVWLDEWEISAGQLSQEAIEKGLAGSRAIAVVVGAGGIGPWERLEMRVAISQFVKRGAPVIPVLLAGVGRYPALPLLLQEFSWVQFTDYPSSDPRAIAKLLGGIGAAY